RRARPALTWASRNRSAKATSFQHDGRPGRQRKARPCKSHAQGIVGSHHNWRRHVPFGADGTFHGTSQASPLWPRSESRFLAGSAYPVRALRRRLTGINLSLRVDQEAYGAVTEAHGVSQPLISAHGQPELLGLVTPLVQGAARRRAGSLLPTPPPARR